MTDFCRKNLLQQTVCLIFSPNVVRLYCFITTCYRSVLTRLSLAFTTSHDSLCDETFDDMQALPCSHVSLLSTIHSVSPHEARTVLAPDQLLAYGAPRGSGSNEPHPPIFAFDAMRSQGFPRRTGSLPPTRSLRRMPPTTRLAYCVKKLPRMAARPFVYNKTGQKRNLVT